MPEIVLRFPILNGGRASGINAADLETFAKDPSHYVARECAQNTLDAVAENGGTAELHFTLEEIPIEKLPCLAELTDVFNRCKEYRQKDRDFYDKGIEILLREKIPVLIVSDYNTTGLTGSDTDVNGRWYGLVKSEGSSNKEDDAGGSFGIGKAAPLVASMLRTVYYSSKTEEGNAFQGVSVQATHKNKDGQNTQNIGYIGYHDESPCQDENYFPAVRDKNAIPSLFDRERAGTSIYIPGFIDVENWKENILKSLLNDFWLAIHNRKISFRIGDVIIDSSTVEMHINSLKGLDGFTADRYYKAYTKGKCFTETLNHIGNINLYLIEAEEFPDKRVSYMRKNLMLIYEEWNFRFRKNFTGLFICDNDNGNKILRIMESPKHEEWQPKKLKRRLPDLDGQKILDSIRQLITAKLKELMPLSVTPQFELSDIKKYLPYSDDDTEHDTGGNQEENERETFKKVAASSGIVSIPVSKSNDMKKDENGEEEALGGIRIGPSKSTPPSPEPNPVPVPSPVPGHNPAVSTPAVIASIKSRILSYSSEDRHYLVALTAEKADFNGNIYLQSVGDDNDADDIKAVSAVCNNGTILVNADGSIPIKLFEGKPQRIKIFVENNEELSLRFIHGN